MVDIRIVLKGKNKKENNTVNTVYDDIHGDFIKAHLFGEALALEGENTRRQEPLLGTKWKGM